MSRLGKILFLFSGISLVSFVVIRFLVSGWVPFLTVALSLFAGFLVAGIYLDRGFFKEFLGMRTTRQGMSMGAMIGLVLVFLIALNILGARKYKTWDFSLAQVNTLSQQSTQLLKALTEDLRVIYFYKNGTEGVEQNRRLFLDLIRKYQDQNDRVKMEFVEVNERPDLAEKYKVTKGSQAVLLEYKGKTNLIEKIDEQELTSALVKVTREKDRKVYVLYGHHEIPLESSSDGQSMAMLKALLEGNRYQVVPFSLTTAPEVPSDADVVIVAGPQHGFVETEVRALENYLKRGGNLILALEPRFTHHLQGLLKTLGVGLEDNFVATLVETPMGKAIDPRFTRGSVFSANSKITSPFAKGEFTLFHLPMALRKISSVQGVEIEELIKTNDSAMSFNSLEFDKGGSKGLFTLAFEIKGSYPGSDSKEKFQLLVFGDSEFLNDQYLYQNLNRDLLLNSIAALAKEENLISISPKDVSSTKMEILDSQFVLYVFLFIIPLPLVFFVASGWIWSRRRHA